MKLKLLMLLFTFMVIAVSCTNSSMRGSLTHSFMRNNIFKDVDSTYNSGFIITVTRLKIKDSVFRVDSVVAEDYGTRIDTLYHAMSTNGNTTIFKNK
jgi:predicted tellurium resistance membrane protein TerC